MLENHDSAAARPVLAAHGDVGRRQGPRHAGPPDAAQTFGVRVLHPVRPGRAARACSPRPGRPTARGTRPRRSASRCRTTEVKIAEPGRPASRSAWGEDGELCARGYQIMRRLLGHAARRRRRPSTARAGCTPATRASSARAHPHQVLFVSGPHRGKSSSAAARTSTPSRSSSCWPSTRAWPRSRVIGVPDQHVGRAGRGGHPGRRSPAAPPDPERARPRTAGSTWRRTRRRRTVVLRGRVPDDAVREDPQVRGAPAVRRPAVSRAAVSRAAASRAA